MVRFVIIAAAAVLLATQPLTCLADTVSDNPYVDVQDGVRYEFRQRVKDLKEQIELGLGKGWINEAQAASLNAEQDRLLKATLKARGEGWPKGQVDELEKGVTALNARVSKALTNGSKSPASANTDSTPSSTASAKSAPPAGGKTKVLAGNKAKHSASAKTKSPKNNN